MTKPQSTVSQPAPSQSSSRIDCKNKRKAKHNIPSRKGRISDKTDSEESDSERKDDDDGKGFV